MVSRPSSRRYGECRGRITQGQSIGLPTIIRLCRSNTEKGEALSIEFGVLADPMLVSVTYWLDGFVQVIFHSRFLISSCGQRGSVQLSLRTAVIIKQASVSKAMNMVSGTD